MTAVYSRLWNCSSLSRCSMPQDEGRCFHNPNHEQRENSHSSEEQENPIYGNLGRDRRGEPRFCHPFTSNNGRINAVDLSVCHWILFSLELGVLGVSGQFNSSFCGNYSIIVSIYWPRRLKANSIKGQQASRTSQPVGKSISANNNNNNNNNVIYLFRLCRNVLWDDVTTRCQKSFKGKCLFSWASSIEMASGGQRCVCVFVFSSLFFLLFIAVLCRFRVDVSEMRRKWQHSLFHLLHVDLCIFFPGWNAANDIKTDS